jgi:7-cyano-7-deazaguanine synthase in queuosine biosynthesis
MKTPNGMSDDKILSLNDEDFKIYMDGMDKFFEYHEQCRKTAMWIALTFLMVVVAPLVGLLVLRFMSQ